MSIGASNSYSSKMPVPSHVARFRDVYDSISRYEIRNVDWGHSAFCTEDFSILYTTGLSSCIAMYCFEDKIDQDIKRVPFGYLYHIWTNNLTLDKDFKGFPELTDLGKEMVRKLSIPNLRDKKINMGLVYGTGQIMADPTGVSLIEEGFANLQTALIQNDINIAKDTPSYISRRVLIDPKGKGLVLSQFATIK